MAIIIQVRVSDDATNFVLNRGEVLFRKYRFRKKEEGLYHLTAPDYDFLYEKLSFDFAGIPGTSASVHIFAHGEAALRLAGQIDADGKLLLSVNLPAPVNNSVFPFYTA